MRPLLTEIWVYLAASPLLWLTVTMLAYLAAYWLYRRSNFNPFVNPVLVAVAFIAVLLLATKTPYPRYFEGAKFIHFLIGPATVALAIPLHAQMQRLKTMWLPLTVALVVGSLVAIISGVGIAWAMGASREIALSLAPKSVTMPIAMGVADKIGGVPALTAVAVAITGISGAIMARSLLNALRIDDDATRGFATGLVAHAIGTARALTRSETTGAFAALAMALNGVATALLAPLLLKLVPLG
ncbi:MAG TPA: LrgB family protein [Burkholderiaceae bacterium]|nr:LrgB family protein [Burkholderiaceae bacterium]